jgi:outer membrane protein insertion porin family
MKKILLAIFLFVAAINTGVAQSGSKISIDYSNPQQYEIGGIKIEGTEFLDKRVLTSISGLKVGDKISIPGEDISKAIKNLWQQKLFTDVSIEIESVIGKTIFLVIRLEELPRLSRYSIEGVKKSDVDDLRKKLNLRSGSIFTESDRVNSVNTIKKFYVEKGFYNTNVEITERQDTVLENSILVKIIIDRGDKVKINRIYVDGNEQYSDRKVKKQLKDTKEKVRFELAELIKLRQNVKDTMPFHERIGDLSMTRAIYYGEDYVNLNIFKSSKFVEKSYEDDKKKLLEHYREKGYRDAAILSDTVFFDENGEVVINILLKEGNLYYIRNIDWVGNTKYSDSLLTKILDIPKGTIYSQSMIDKKLFMDPNGGDISSLYMDDGYLFFNITPVEKRIVNDSVDLEMKVYEGPQATINEVRIYGNTKTNEKVIRRELRVLPGNKFSRSDLIRSQREIVNLGYFDPEQMEVIPFPNPENGTVDIEFRVVEKPSDQLELSAGWGGRGNGLIGTLGVQFTNFSLRGMFDKKAWSPLPSGDGQNLSVRVQSNGKMFQSYNFAFTEPWLGGRKPNALSLSFFRQRWNDLTLGFRGDVRGSLITTGGSVGIGTRLKWPDDFFIIRSAVNVQRYNLDNFFLRDFIFDTGKATNINLSTTLSRNSIDNPLFPKRGSNVSFTFEFTLPYSKLIKSRRDLDYASADLSPEKRYTWVEYHKYRFDAEWFTPIVGNLILHTSAKLGFLGQYNKNIGVTPFQRYELGGEGFNQAQFLGRDIVGLRGYDILTPDLGAPIFNKYIMELRYPLSLNPSATVYVLGFAEAGNFWMDVKDYRPYDLKRSVGAGLRVFLPMFGLLGFDYGIGFDNTGINAITGNNVFQKYGKFRIILGFEPQ